VRVLSQRAQIRRRRTTWAGTEIGSEAKVAEAKAEIGETKDESGNEAVAWGTARTPLEME
jgi:hypothetical protein